MRRVTTTAAFAAFVWLAICSGRAALADGSAWKPISPSEARIAWDGPGLEGTRRQHQRAEVDGLSRVERALWSDAFPVPRLSITFVALPPNRVFVSTHLKDFDDEIRTWFAAAPSIVLDMPAGTAGVPAYAQWQTRRFRIANPDGHCLAFRQFFGGTTWYDYLQGQGLEDGQGLGTRSVFGWACSPDPRDMDASRITGCISVEPYISRHCGHPLAPATDATRDARGGDAYPPVEQTAEKGD